MRLFIELESEYDAFNTSDRLLCSILIVNGSRRLFVPPCGTNIEKQDFEMNALMETYNLDYQVQRAEMVVWTQLPFLGILTNSTIYVETFEILKVNVE